MWKNKIKNLNFAKIGRNSYFSHCLLHHSDLLYKLLQYSIHYYKIITIQITIHAQVNALKTKQSLHNIVIIVNKQKTSCKLYQITKNLEILPTIKQFKIYQHILKISSNNSNIKTTKLILTLMK